MTKVSNNWPTDPGPLKPFYSDLRAMLTNGISFADNILAAEVALSLPHGTKLLFDHPRKFMALAFWPYEARDASGKLLQLIGNPILDPLPKDSSGQIIRGKYGLTAHYAPTTDGETSRSAIAQASAVALTTDTPANVTSLSLGAGKWMLSGGVAFVASGGYVGTYIAGLASTSSGSFGTPGDNRSESSAKPVVGVSDSSVTLPPYPVTLASPSTVYLTAVAGFSAGALKAYGHLQAVRLAIDPATAATVTGVLVGG